MANQSHEEIHEIQNVFHRYDTDASGGIDKRELLKALSELGVECTIKQLDQVMRKFAGGAEELNIIEFNSLVQTLRVARQNGRQVKVKDILPYQDVVRRFYQHGVVMGVFTALIVSNFLSNIIEKEIDPASTLYADTWLQLDNAFNIIFLVELLINMYGCGGPQRREFYSSMWNLFDTVIVVVGLLLMTGADFGPFNKVRRRARGSNSRDASSTLDGITAQHHPAYTLSPVVLTPSLLSDGLCDFDSRRCSSNCCAPFAS